MKLLWSEDERREEDGSSSATQPLHVYSDIVKELLAQLDEVENGPNESRSSPTPEDTKIEGGAVEKQAVKSGHRIEADSGGDDIQTQIPSGEVSKTTPIEEATPCMDRDTTTAALSTRVAIVSSF